METSAQLLVILLDYTTPVDLARRHAAAPSGGVGQVQQADVAGMGNLFCSFISRLHQTEVSNTLALVCSGNFNMYIYISS